MIHLIPPSNTTEVRPMVDLRPPQHVKPTSVPEVAETPDRATH
jgi:hypothetical protein